MKTPHHSLDSITSLLPQIQAALRDIRLAEIKNYEDGFHLWRSNPESEEFERRWSCLKRREQMFIDLKKLLRRAVPAGISAGFTGEHVVEKISELSSSVAKAINWESNDEHLEVTPQILVQLFEEASEKVEPFYAWLAAELPPEANNVDGQENTHSANYTSVIWCGIAYEFTKGLQTEAIRVLWEAWKNGTPSLSEKTIGEKCGSQSDKFQLSKVFRTKKKGGGYEMHAAWGAMIKKVRKGTYQLAQ